MMVIWLMLQINACQTDPVGHASPKFPSNDQISTYRKARESFALFCRAQGNPAPQFRYRIVSFSFLFDSVPVGSTSPDIPPESTFIKKVEKEASSFALTCSGQANPVPSFRFIFRFSSFF